MVYVTAWGSDLLVAIDPANLLVVKQMRTGRQPYSLTISPDGRTCYIPNSGENTVSVVSLSRFEEIKRIPVGVDPRSIALAPSRDLLLVSCFGSDSVSTINLRTLERGPDIPVGTEPYMVEVTPDERWALTPNWGANTVSLIDLETRQEIAQEPVGSLPRWVRVTPDANQAFVSNFNDNTLSVLDIRDGKLRVEASVPVARGPFGIEIADGNLVVCNFLASSVEVFDLETRTLRFRILLEGKHPKVARQVPGTPLYFVANELSENVSVVNIRMRSDVKQIPVGRIPYGVAIGPRLPPTEE